MLAALKDRLKQISVFGWMAIFVVLLATFLRFYNLKGSLLFQGDQGRDSIIVSQIFTKKDLVFIGPVTSVGNMYLGPLYYYFMMPFLWLSYPSPMGPVWAVAFLGVLTIFLMYHLGKKMIGQKAALFSAFLMTLSATVSVYTRFSWNPNPAPLVSLLLIFSVFKALRGKYIYWAVSIGLIAVLIQLHYLTFLAVLPVGLLWIDQVISLTNKNSLTFKSLKKVFVFTLLGALIFVLSLTPLVLFDLKHQGLNFSAFKNMIFKSESFQQTQASSSLAKFTKTVLETEGRAMHILFEINIGKNRPLNQSLTLITLIALLYLWKKEKNKSKKIALNIIVAFLFTGIIGTALYQHSVFDHYIAYLFPVTFFVFGIIFSTLWKKFFGKIISFMLIIGFAAYNIPKQPLKTLGLTVDEFKYVAQTITDRVDEGEKYNIVLLSESKDHYGQNYRYFLTTSTKPPINPESREEISKLFIINEEKKTEDVTSLPIYNIVVFPNKTPVDYYEIPDVAQITVLKTEVSN